MGVDGKFVVHVNNLQNPVDIPLNSEDSYNGFFQSPYKLDSISFPLYSKYPGTPFFSLLKCQPLWVCYWQPYQSALQGTIILEIFGGVFFGGLPTWGPNHPMTEKSKWFITMVIASPLRIGLVLFEMPCNKPS